MTDPVRVGLVGAGPWAEQVHAPVLAAGPETMLAGVWARRPEAANALAARHGARAFDTVDDLFDAVDVVAFAVPPDVQADLAVRAARAGRHVLLEKPVAGDLAAAERLAAAVDEAGVVSMVVLSLRYTAEVRSFLDGVRGGSWFAGRAHLVSGALLGGPFATPWRLDRGPLLDLGPHVVDLLVAALGPVTGAHVAGRRRGWVALALEHASGVVSQASLCATVGIDTSRFGIEVFGGDGVSELDGATVDLDAGFAQLRRELAGAVRAGRPHELDVHRGVELQRVLEVCDRQLRE